MSGKERRHQGVRIVADFKDRAIPMGAADGACSPAPARRSANEGIQPLADVQNAALFLAGFPDAVRALTGPGANVFDVLNALLAQLNKGQEENAELKKQNAALKASVLENGRVIDRYHLGGPNEDEI